MAAAPAPSTLICILLLAFVATSALAASQKQLLVDLSVVPNTPRLVLAFNVTNPAYDAEELPLSVLTWGTPMEEGNGLMGPIFEVSDSHGNSVPYVGKLVRRRYPPMLSSYITLGSRESYVVEVDITDEFDFPGAGDYRIHFVAPQFDDYLTFVPTGDVIGSLPIINRRSAQDKEQPLGSTNCSPAQLNQVTTAVNGAVKESLTAHNCLTKKTCSALSTRWFGAYSAANDKYDTDMFLKVYNRLADFTFNAYCNPAGCGNDVYAYVYPTDKTYTVYLCGAFWSQANERVNTVVHEMSHFSTLGGTDDYAYGKSACLSLAKSNPARASHNADNVCYFSEEAAKLF